MTAPKQNTVTVDSTKTDERVKITPGELDAMMPKGDRVHTYMQAGPMLLGADWERSEILKAAARGAELSGEQATKAKHGAVVWNEDETPVFIETLPASDPTLGADSVPEGKEEDL